jgi:hypothetical protein
MKKILFLFIALLVISTNSFGAFIADKDGDFVNVGANGHLDVSVGDQTTPPLIINFSSSDYQPTLTADTNIGDTTITVSDATGFVAGTHIILANPLTGRYYFGHQVGAIATLTVTLDTPLDYAFDAAFTEVSVGSHDMTVAGSLASPIVFSVRAGEQTDVPTTVDITRIILTCTDDTSVDFTKFCGGTTLTNGIVLRRTDGTTQNIFNAKSNIDLANIMYDFTVFSSSVGQQGIDGFMGRLTFAGQNKMGVAIRLGPGEDLELLIQDDLTGLVSFEVIAEGHVVQPN